MANDITMTKPKAKQPETETERKQRHAPRYRVLVHNDDVTPILFVVEVLRTVFQKATEEAVDITVTAHNKGIALVVTLPLEQAEFRVDRAHAVARTAKYPLRFSYEPEE